MRGGWLLRRRELLPESNDDVLRHALVEWNDLIAHLAFRARVVKDTDDGGVSALQDAGDAAQTAAIGTGGRQLHQHLVALHGAINFIGWDENVVFPLGTLSCVRSHEPVAVAVQIEPAGNKIVTRAATGFFGNGPVLAIGFHQIAARRHAGKLLEQQTTFAATAEA